MIPVDVMLKLETKLEWAAWAAIALHWGPNKPQVFAYQKNMAESVGLSVDALGTGIKRLRDKGLIEVLRTRNGNRYRLPSLENPRVPEDEHPPKTRVSETSEKGVSDTPKKRDYKEQTNEQTIEQTKEQTTQQTKRKRSAPASVVADHQELWDHWLPIIKSHFPRRKYPDQPTKTDTRNLADALKVFTVDELKIALTGLIPWMQSDDWWAEKDPAFIYAFSSGRGAGKAFDLERTQKCIEAGQSIADAEDGQRQRIINQRIGSAFKEAIERMMAAKDTPSDGPKTHNGRKVLAWFVSKDAEGVRRFKWAKLAEYDDGVSCKRAFALRAMLENTENPAARQLIETAMVDADWRVRDAIGIDDQRAKDRQRAEEKRKRMEAEHEAAGCPIYDVEELPF